MGLVAVKPELIDWAIERSGLDIEIIEKKFPKLYKWRRNETSPTINQLENFARKTHTPLGYFFLEEPPIESLPVPVFRTIKDQKISRPTPDLIDTIRQMQLRSAWMREFLIGRDERPLSFVSSTTINNDVKIVADNIRTALRLREDWSSQYSSWTNALDGLFNSVDSIGILIMKNGVVGNNNRRKLNFEEFRGFVLIDEYAPLIFVNGADYKGAQMFTIAHELAHVWIGQGGIFDLNQLLPSDDTIEDFCDKVAAEFLVPASTFSKFWNTSLPVFDSIKNLSKKFKVSSIVIGRRALDLGYINFNQFIEFYNIYKDEQDEIVQRKKETKKSGGDFYNNQNVRIGKRFASAVIISAKEGSLSYRDAFKLTGLKGKTFDEYSKKLGIN